MDQYLETHRKLIGEYELEVSNINECWGEMWDPYSPTFKTLTEPTTADLAVKETKTTLDFGAGLGAKSVTIAVAIHAAISEENVSDATNCAIDALQRMAE